jgi:hypothetical protein
MRPAAKLMHPLRAGAAYPNPLNFARTFMRELVQGRWRLEKARIDLDPEGRGEVLYRLSDGRHVFHFFVISDNFAQDQKMDRSFGLNWDGSAALCQGEWTAEREDYLRRQIPMQRFGRYDLDTLVFARGNRSERLFDYVVDCLAKGYQPDPRRLAAVGYIFRTTGFVGNGSGGMRQFSALGDRHPFRKPYQTQMCSAFLLREYVFDLAEHMARHRNSEAPGLDPSLKRYLGIGNSAGVGLIPFVHNHPHIIHRWCASYEEAVVSAMATPVLKGSRELNGFKALLDKAIAYFTQDPRSGNGFFADYIVLAEQLAAIKEWTSAQEAKSTEGLWEKLCVRVEREHHPETLEILHAIILEQYPYIVAVFADQLLANEESDLVPDMPVGTLKTLLRTQYAWALEATSDANWHHYFWYLSTEAPREPRRGIRGRRLDLEFESEMDLPIKVRRLDAHLTALPDTMTVAEVLAAAPILRDIVLRVQSLAASPYGELRANAIAQDYRPFYVIRFVLAFYGMEKFDPQPPIWVKGAFLQGAPIAEDVAAGRDGSWPFPLIPDPPKVAGAGVSRALRLSESPEAPASIVKPALANIKISKPPMLVLSPLELKKLVDKALEADRIPSGVAFDLTQAVVLEQQLHGTGIEAFLRVRGGLAWRTDCALANVEQRDAVAYADACGHSAALIAPAVLDLANVRALVSTSGIGAAVVRNIGDASLLEFIVAKGAKRRLISIVLANSKSTSNPYSIVLGGPAGAAPWIASASYSRPSTFGMTILDALDARADGDRGLREILLRDDRSLATERLRQLFECQLGSSALRSTLVIVCIKASCAESAPWESLHVLPPATATIYNPSQIQKLIHVSLTEGLQIRREDYEAIAEVGARALVPVEIEHEVQATV